MGHFSNDPKAIDADIESYMKVTPADIQRAAAKYFTKEKTTVIDVQPTKKTAFKILRVTRNLKLPAEGAIMDLSTKTARSLLSLLVALSTVQSAALAETAIDKPSASTTVTIPGASTADTGKLEVPSASISGDQWRKKSAYSASTTPIQIANNHILRLDNGLQVQLIEDHRVPFLTVALGIKAGSTFEPKDKLGFVRDDRDMLNEGTTSKEEQRNCRRD